MGFPIILLFGLFVINVVTAPQTREGASPCYASWDVYYFLFGYSWWLVNDIQVLSF